MSNRKHPTISVIMSVYNNEEYLSEAIESVLNQSYKDFEFIITDDASTDRSREIIEKYAKKDSRIKILNNEKNIGLTKSLNNMIEISSGEYIARMDGDDICLPHRLEHQLQTFKSKDIQISFGDTILIDHYGKVLCHSWRPNKLSTILKLLKFKIHNYIPHPTVMLRKEVFEKYGKYDTQFTTGQDEELWRRLLSKKVKFYYERKPLLMYRINPSSVRAKRGENYNYKIASILIANRHKKKSIKYFSKLTTKEKILLIFKIISPYWFKYAKSILISLKRNF